MRKSQKFYLPFKRLIAIIGSFIGIIIMGVFVWPWVFIVNAIVTKGHPVFAQERLGKNKKVFKLLKFRSMRTDVNPYWTPSSTTDEEREKLDTKFGYFLRKSSIDETLQLLNIFVGNMAFIGPRPGAARNEEELVKIRDSYNPSIYCVRPGLGGYAQLKMNRGHDPVEKSKYDFEYIKKLSFLFDIKIFVLTAIKSLHFLDSLQKKR